MPAEAGGQKLKTVLVETGMTQNRFLPAMYHLIVDNEPQVIMATRVDDLLWGETEKGSTVMKTIREGKSPQLGSRLHKYLRSGPIA